MTIKDQQVILQDSVDKKVKCTSVKSHKEKQLPKPSKIGLSLNKINKAIRKRGTDSEVINFDLPKTGGRAVGSIIKKGHRNR